MEFEHKALTEVNLVPQFANIMGEPLLPPSHDVFEEFTQADFKEKYPVRHLLFSEFASLRSDFSKEALTTIKRLGKYLHMLNRADEYITRHENGELTLWPDQFRAFCQLRDGLEKGETDGRIKMPTSSGKTVLFTEFIEAIGTKTNWGDDFKTLIVVPDQKPVKQTKEKMEKFAPNLPVGVVYGNKKDLGEKEQGVTVITDESLKIQLEKETIDPLTYDLLVLDEADVYLTPPKQSDIAKFANATRVGLSATMEYGPQKKVADYLPHPYFEMGIKEGVENGDLSPFTVLHAFTTADISNVHIRAGEYKEEDLALVLDIETRNQAAVELYDKMFSGKAGIVYCLGVSHAEKLAELFNQKGIKAAYISGYMNETERDEIYRKYKSGGIDMLCNSDILIRSFDEPRAEVCLNLRPTLSKVVAEQRAGRVLRKDPNNPSKHAYIVDFIDQNNDARKNQVLFAEIAGSAHIEGKAFLNSTSSQRTTEPSPLPDIQIEGLRVVTNTEEVMTIAKESSRSIGEWTSFSRVMEELKLSTSWMKKRIKMYELDHPESLRIENGERKRVYLSQDLISFLKQEREKFKETPAGWVASESVAFEVQRSREWVTNKMEQLKKEHPDWFDYYPGRNGTLSHLMSDEARKHIISLAENQAAAPEDWVSIKRLAASSELSDKWLRRMVPSLMKTDQDNFRILRTPDGQDVPHISPKGIEVLQQMFKELKSIPEHWVPLREAAVVAGKSLSWAKKRLSEYNSAQYRLYYDEFNHPETYVSEDVALDLMRRVEAFPTIPEGWAQATLFQSKHKVSPKWIEDRLDESEVNREAHHKKFISEASTETWYISPEAQEHLLTLIAPDGWVSANDLSVSLGRTVTWVTTQAKKIAETNPDSVKKFKGTRKFVYYLTSEASSLIEKKSNDQPLPPEGWVRGKTVADLLNKNLKWSRNQIQRLKEEHPDWVKSFRANAHNGVGEYISPEGLQYLKSQTITAE